MGFGRLKFCSGGIPVYHSSVEKYVCCYFFTPGTGCRAVANENLNGFATLRLRQNVIYFDCVTYLLLLYFFVLVFSRIKFTIFGVPESGFMLLFIRISKNRTGTDDPIRSATQSVINVAESSMFGLFLLK